MKKKTEPSTFHREASADLRRVIGLSDGIFAFALTLLALDLRLPDIPNLTVEVGLAGLLPKLLIFLISFLIIGNQWDVHQRTFLHIARADAKFSLLNLLSLLFVIILPAAAAVLGRFPPSPWLSFALGLIQFC